LIELLVSLTLLALASAVLYGAISLASNSWDRGEARSQQTRQMRLAQEFLRSTLSTAHPVRLNGAGESLLPFAGANDWVTFPAQLPDRVGGGLYYFKLGLTPRDKDSQLTLQRVIPKLDSQTRPEFSDAEVSILADGVRGLKLRYFGADNQRSPDSQPVWQDRWEDRAQWPLLVRLDLAPAEGPPWPPLIVELKLAEQSTCDEVRKAHNLCDQN
jgi:general secretion pathway protein J